MEKLLVLRFAVRESMGVVLMAVTLIWSSGDPGWLAAWAVVVITAAWAVATGVVIVRANPALLAERLGPRQGARRWDTVLMSVYGLLQFAVLLIAGLDHRYGWTQAGGPVSQVAGFVFCSLGYSLTVWATASNAFFSQIVRIQSERGHTVQTGGPYHYVRHPGYAGSILTAVSVPVLLASLWAIALGLISVLLMVLRTSMEDETLRVELPGYADYARHVRRRLIPWVW
jgi:protein-S-isoprenylcysteine O-methyltransferase Ste14